MIEINLLPEEARKKKKEKAVKALDLSGFDLSKISLEGLKNIPMDTPVARWTITAIAFFVAFHILLFGIGVFAKLRTGALTRRYEVLSPQKKEADMLRSQSESITSKVGAINGLMVKRFSWAKKLNALSDSMAVGVWLNELSYDNKVAERIMQKSPSARNKKGASGSSTEKFIVNYLVLAGYTSQVGEGGAALVGKFIKSLKNNPSFYSDFNDITLVSVKSDKAEGQEVMSFNIICPFKENKE
jgi:hypothetical protein